MSSEHPHNYYVTDNAREINFQWVLDELRATYFGVDRTMEQLVEASRNSLCFAIMRREYVSEGFPSHIDRMAGFARIITDRTHFAWLADFVVAPELRGRGVGYQMMHAILSHHALRGLTVNLCTRDAQDFYKRFGFAEAIHLMLKNR